jgi:hypothetical protein
LFAGFTCFFALLQLGSIALSVAGVRLDRSVAVAVVAVSAVLSLLLATRFVRSATVGMAADESRPQRGTGPVIGAVGLALLAWAAFVWARLWMLAWHRPPYDWDGLYYHIPAIHEWVVAGRLVWVHNVPDVPWVNYPMGVELTTFLAYQLFDTSRLVNACNLWYWPLAVVSLAVIAERLGARGSWRWIAGAFVVGAPVFVSQSVSCYIDVGFASTVLASLAAALVFLFDDEHPYLWKGILLGAAVGLMAGAKGTGLPFSVVLVLSVALASLWVRRSPSRGRRRWGVAAAVLVALAVAGFWYIRLAAHTGNPVYPIELKIGEKVVFEGNDVSGMMEENVSEWFATYPPALRTFVSWLQLDAPVHGYDPIGGLGYIWIAGAIPAIVLLGYRRMCGRRRFFLAPFAVLTVLTLVLLAVLPTTWWSRFTVWLHALGLPAIVVVAHEAAMGWKRKRAHLVTLVLFAAAACLVVWESRTTLELEWNDGRTANAGQPGAPYVSSSEYVFPGITQTVGVRVLFGSRVVARGPWGYNGTLLGGMLAMPLGEREIIALPPDPTGAEIDALRERGVQWIVWDLDGAEIVPESIAQRAVERHGYPPQPESEFIFLRLAAVEP